jgi:hypothetical protein
LTEQHFSGELYYLPLLFANPDAKSFIFPDWDVREFSPA